MKLAWIVLSVSLAASCKGGDVGETDPSDADTDVEGDADTDADTDSDTDSDPVDIVTATGTLTWSVDFDAAAEGAGYADCTYQRTYTNGAEIRHSPWLCPDCDVVVQIDAEITSGRTDCYDLISGSDPAPVERLGWGGGGFYRSSSENYLLSAQGTSAVAGTSVDTLNEVPFTFKDADGTTWNAGFRVVGDLETGTAVGDPMDGLYPPDAYACGWPKANPPAYTGNYELALGATVPDGVFWDQCEEPVRIHDLAGRWLVLDVAATDCGPCQAMADSAVEFEEKMAGQGIDVMGVTLLAPSLGDTLGNTDAETLYDWAYAFDLTDPVVADRGYGVWVVGMGAEAITGEGFGYPTWVVVSPELEVVSVNIGFGSWDDVEATILANTP